jgi:hypothetical protein
MTACQGKRQGVCLYSEWRHLEKGGWKTEARADCKWQVVRYISCSHSKDTCSASCEGFQYLKFFTTQQESETGRGEVNFLKRKEMSTKNLNIKNKVKIDKWLLPLNSTSCIINKR